MDGQNIYKGARDAFFSRTDPFTRGQFDPYALGQLLTQRSGKDRHLKQVRIYTGQPDATKQPKGYGASRKQYAAWRGRGVEVTSRPLRYPPSFPAQKPEEKGIDVQIAIDIVSLALDSAFDLAILFSSDTDLVPALNFVVDRCPSLRLEVAAWQGRARIRTARRSIWCHFLDRGDYDLVADSTNYAR